MGKRWVATTAMTTTTITTNIDKQMTTIKQPPTTKLPTHNQHQRLRNWDSMKKSRKDPFDSGGDNTFI